MSDLIEQWLARFEELEPVDGTLTQEILDAVGAPPMPNSASAPKDAMARAADIGALKGRVKTNVMYRRNEYLAEAAKQEEMGNKQKVAEMETKANYWESLWRWVERYR
jgi:hypothetical protein